MIDWKSQWKPLAAITAVFATLYWLPVGWVRFDNAVMEALHLAKWYAQEHVLLCLVPAFFIAGAISVFVSQAGVMKYLGVRANKILAYGVAAVSGSVLAACSCTVLPLFAGIWRMGAGLGPATAFLYSGPAINVLAIILTARVLGFELGVARAIGAVSFSILIGLAMHLIYRKEEHVRADGPAGMMPASEISRPLWKNAAFFAAMVAVMVFANWARSGDSRAVFLCCPGGLATYVVEGQVLEQGNAEVRIKDAAGQEHHIAADRLQRVESLSHDTVQDRIYAARWLVVAAACGLLAWMLARWFRRDELTEWTAATWGLARQMLPLLLAGVLVAGLLLGRPGREGLIPGRWVEALLGARPETFLSLSGLGGGAFEPLVRAVWTFWTNLFAAVFGAFMYFATLTEVPIVQGLIGAGMGKGPALALLLSGPSVSLPSMLVIAGVLGTRKTIVYVSLVIGMSTVAGMIFGAEWG